MRTSGKLSELSGCSIKYLERRAYHSARSDWGPHVASAAFLSRRLDSSRNLYRKDLYAHYGCVNAIEFSKEGDLLVSGKFCISSFSPVCRHMYTLTYTYIHICAWMHTCMHTNTCMYMYIEIHTHMIKHLHGWYFINVDDSSLH